MATLDHEDAELHSSDRPAMGLPKLRWPQILAISIFWFALNFHWAAIFIIIVAGTVAVRFIRGVKM